MSRLKERGWGGVVGVCFVFLLVQSVEAVTCINKQRKKKKNPQKTTKLVIKMRHAVNRFTFSADPMGKIKRRG